MGIGWKNSQGSTTVTSEERTAFYRAKTQGNILVNWNKSYLLSREYELRGACLSHFQVDLKTFASWDDSPEKMMMDMMADPNSVTREDR